MKKLLALVLACMIALMGCAFADSEVVDPNGLEGSWVDSVSERARMEIFYDDGTYGNPGLYNVNIQWANSAFDSVEWVMSGTFEDVEDGRIHAEDCIKYVVTHDANGDFDVQTIYENGIVNITLVDGILYWNDFTEDAGDECMFVPYVEEAPVVEMGDDMREYYNPNNYNAIRVTDVFDLEGVVIQGCIGNINEDGVPEYFDSEATVTLSFVPGAEIMMPVDIDNPEELVQCDNLEQWFWSQPGVETGTFYFYATFSMNEAGELRNLVFKEVL